MSSKLRPDAKEWAPSAPAAAAPTTTTPPTSGYVPRGPRGGRGYNANVPEFTPAGYYPPQQYYGYPPYQHQQYYPNDYGYTYGYPQGYYPQQGYPQNYVAPAPPAAPTTSESSKETPEVKEEVKSSTTVEEPKKEEEKPAPAVEEKTEIAPPAPAPAAVPEEVAAKPSLTIIPPSDGSEWKQKATLPSPSTPANEEWKRGMVSAEKTCAQMMMRKDGITRYDKATLQQLFSIQACDDTIKAIYGSLAFLRAPAAGAGGVGYLHPDVSVVFSQENLSREDTFKHDPNRLVDDTNPTTMFNKAKLILNQLTITNYDKLANKFISLPIFQNPLPEPTEPVEGQMQPIDVLIKLINELVMKAQLEEKFCYMYANLAKVIIEGSAVGEQFKDLLLRRCEEEFLSDRQATIDKILALDLPDDEKEEKLLVAKLRYLGHMRLIGELYLLDLIHAKIMRYCLGELLMDPKEIATSDDEERYVCVCKLLSTIGYKLERYEQKKSKATPIMNGYFETIKRLSKDESDEGGAAPVVSSRIRCLFLDLLEMRQKGWKERRAEERMVVVGGGVPTPTSAASTPKSGLKPSGSDEWTEVKGQKKGKVTIKTPSFGRGVQDARAMSGTARSTVIKKPPTPKTAAASKPATGGVAAPAVTPSILDDSGHVQEGAMRKVVSLLEEYFVAGELGETMDSLKALVPPKEYVPFLSRVFKHSMDLKDKQRTLIVDVIGSLVEDQPQQLIPALSKFFEDFEDMVIDAPHCATYIGAMLATFVERELLDDFKVLCVNESHPLFESPAAADVITRALMAIVPDQQQAIYTKTFQDQSYSDLQKDMLKDALRKHQLSHLVV